MAIIDQRPAGRSSRNHFVEPPSLPQRTLGFLPRGLRRALGVVWNRIVGAGAAIISTYEQERRRNKRAGTIHALLRMLFTIPNLLLLMWLGTLWWGERSVFKDSVRECQWENWESWPKDSDPSHVVFIADPQLVDAHTYPGRIWPLSSLTVFYADLYLYRTYSLLQQYLQPDATLFLGDLFDGGREWGTRSSTSPDARYKDYGNDTWMKEYRRFMKLFLGDTWKSGGTASSASPGGRTVIASLPGNHDLGFGNGIQLPVLERFRSFFGEGNRIDIIGNHTFVSVDSVSLSAMDQPDPATGGSGTGGAAASEIEKIWKPTEEFLDNAQALKEKAIREELLLLKGDSEKYQSPHAVTSAENPAKPTELPALSTADFPTIVLTHVPFYREAGTPCGPLREHHPPSSSPPPEKDDRNAIQISRGYQYQNVLTETISKDVATKAGPLVQIYSGDDHDYCEITHREFNGGPKEITVKSISLAMGVRRPGFQMASLWNPIDPDTGKAATSTSSPTLDNHLCLLPDQISIFVQYAYIFVFTVLVLFLRALALAFRTPGPTATYEPILPLTHRHPDDQPSSPSSSTTSSANTFAPSLQDTTRPMRNGQTAGLRRLDADVRDKKWTARQSVSPERDIPTRGVRRSIFIFRSELLTPLKRICISAFAWYLLLVWTW